MRILMTTDTVGGVWTYSTELTRALGKRNIEVVLAAMGGRATKGQLRTLRGISGLEYHESTYKLEWMENPWEDVAAAGEWLLGLQRQSNAHLAHINGYAHAALRWDIPVVAVGHSCVYSWFHWVEKHSPPCEWESYRARVRIGLGAADCVVCPTHAMLHDLKSFYGPFRRNRVIANGRSSHDFIPGQKEHFIFGAGRLWDRAKNMELLAVIAPRVPWPIMVAGSATHPSGGDVELCNVKMLGQLDAERMGHCLSRASIYAAPARYEPFGLCALEAGLAGCCLVLGDIPSYREVWGESALFVSPDDPEAWTEALVKLIRNPSLRMALAGAARERALQYGPEQMAQSYHELYHRLLSPQTVEAPA